MDSKLSIITLNVSRLNILNNFINKLHLIMCYLFKKKKDNYADRVNLIKHV